MFRPSPERKLPLHDPVTVQRGDKFVPLGRRLDRIELVQGVTASLVILHLLGFDMAPYVGTILKALGGLA